MAVIITDRDAVIAAAGVSRKEYLEKKVSGELEDIMESRNLYTYRRGGEKLRVTDEGGVHYISCAMPILSQGDLIGCVLSVLHEDAEQEEDENEEEYCEEQPRMSFSVLFLPDASFLGTGILR